MKCQKYFESPLQFPQNDVLKLLSKCILCSPHTHTQILSHCCVRQRRATNYLTGEVGTLILMINCFIKIVAGFGQWTNVYIQHGPRWNSKKISNISTNVSKLTSRSKYNNTTV